MRNAGEYLSATVSQSTARIYRSLEEKKIGAHLLLSGRDLLRSALNIFQLDYPFFLSFRTPVAFMNGFC